MVITLLHKKGIIPDKGYSLNFVHFSPFHHKQILCKRVAELRKASNRRCLMEKKA
ncbi:hypothetical protein KIN20_025264 [Parelaphostrongylus tenuis]|uniref:Uncharacterized protein n=1 Tax=Parelaphostrongylus tenuis TaxID=148309 RepID=A0AAD5QWJ3_PARTN|nr:hypothetical protein KIN20_025264 [Parelaphostrongylus tenuis]